MSINTYHKEFEQRPQIQYLEVPRPRKKGESESPIPSPSNLASLSQNR